jgi:hypothetical protein
VTDRPAARLAAFAAALAAAVGLGAAVGSAAGPIGDDADPSPATTEVRVDSPFDHDGHP